MFVFEVSCGGDSTSLLSRELTVLTGRKFFLIPELESKLGLSTEERSFDHLFSQAQNLWSLERSRERMSFFSINTWAVEILNGAYISNPPPPKINLKNDTAVKKGKKGAPRKIKGYRIFFSFGQTQRGWLLKERAFGGDMIKRLL